MQRSAYPILASLLFVFTISLVVSMGATTANAQEVAVPVEPAPESGTEATIAEPVTGMTGDPFLWQIQGPSGSVYLLGTIHMGIGANELDQSVWEAFNSSSVAVFEADVRAVNPFQIMATAIYQGEDSLEPLFEPESWQRLVETLSSSIPESMLRTYRPWFLFMIITQSMLPASEPMDLSLLVATDGTLARAEFLESWELQINLMNSIPDQVMIEQILEWVDDPATVEGELATMVDGYRTGDVDLVSTVALAPEDLERWPELYESLMFERNRNWLPLVEGYIAQGGVFIAVGLAHLIGDGSVVDLLRERGHTVTRVTAATPE